MQTFHLLAHPVIVVVVWLLAVWKNRNPLLLHYFGCKKHVILQMSIFPWLHHKLLDAVVSQWNSIFQVSLCVFHPPYLPLSSSRHISCRDCGKLRLIYGSRCAVSPIGDVCVMASIWALSKQMRIQRSWQPEWTLCRQAPAGSTEPPFNPCRFVSSVGFSH